jgi:hypothetical protein
VLLFVVQQMASLAQRHEVARFVVGRIVVPMSCCQHDACCADVAEVLDHQRLPNPPPLPVSPDLPLGIPPTTIA